MKLSAIHACLVALVQVAAGVQSPAPNWSFRTHMSVETAAERPSEYASQTLINTFLPPDTQGAVSKTQQASQ